MKLPDPVWLKTPKTIPCSAAYTRLLKKDSNSDSQGGAPLDENELMFVLFVIFVIVF